MKDKTVSFSLHGLLFEYDAEKNKSNIEKHGISFKIAARVFFDYGRIELYDEENSHSEDRYDTIGDVSFCMENDGKNDSVQIHENKVGIIFVVYTERVYTLINGKQQPVIRIISARLATNFERGLYYGKQD